MVGHFQELFSMYPTCENPWVPKFQIALPVPNQPESRPHPWVPKFQIALPVPNQPESRPHPWVPKFQIALPVPNQPESRLHPWVPKFQIAPPVPNSLKLKVLFCTTCMPIPNINTNIMIGIILPSLNRLCILLIFQRPPCRHYSTDL